MIEETIKRKRGRPKGSRNKATIEAELNLNPVTMEPRKNFRFRAASCGCEQTSLIFGAGMFCKHKNSMKLIQE